MFRSLTAGTAPFGYGSESTLREYSGLPSRDQRERCFVDIFQHSPRVVVPVLKTFSQAALTSIAMVSDNRKEVSVYQRMERRPDFRAGLVNPGGVV